MYRVLIAGERLVVLSWMNGSLATEVAIYDRNTGGSVDRFWCYDAAPSPDGRWIAFVKFFPSHGMAQWESQYRLYDPGMGSGLAFCPPLRTTVLQGDAACQATLQWPFGAPSGADVDRGRGQKARPDPVPF